MKGSRSQYSSGFDPNQIPGCAVWLDAADRNTLTLSGSNVTQWNDKSGSGNNASGGVSPTYTNNGVVFNGTNMYLSTNYSAVPTSETVLIVATWAGGAERNYDLIGTSVTNGRNYNVYAANPPYIKWDIWGVGGYAFTYGVTSNVRFLTTGVYSGGSGTTGFNGGTQSSPASFSASGTGKTNIGAGVLGDYYNGTINEIIIYNSALTQSQYRQIEGYLAKKWGLLGSLPATHPFKSVPPTLRPFAPIDVPGCQLWLDAADPATVTLSGSNVTQWNDKSGRGCNATKAAAGTITLSNNRIVFNGTSYLSLPSGTLPTGNSDYTFLTVGTTDRSSYQNILFTGNYTSGQAIDAIYYPNGALESGWFTANIVAPAGTISANQTTLVENVYSSPTLTAYVNGTSVASSSSLGTRNNPADFTVLGGNREGNQALIGTMCEFILYSNGLTTTQRQQVEGYLAKKWGLQPNLPSGHPYYYAPPFSFTPTSITGCALWLDGADQSSMTLSGSNVTQWNDKSGNGKHATAAGTPTYLSSGGIQLNGSTDYFSNTNFAYNLSTRSIFVVVKINTYAINTGIVVFIPSPSSGSDWETTTAMTIETVSNSFRAYGNTGGYDSFTSATLTNVNLFNDNMNGRSGSSFLFGTQSTAVTASYTAGTTSGYVVGGRWISGAVVSGARLSGIIYEVVMYTGPVTSTQRQQVEGYLAHKWGLRTRLPAPHPYQYSLPAMTSGFTPLTFASDTPTTSGVATIATFLTTTDQTMTYTGTLSSLSVFTGGTGVMAGNFISKRASAIAPSAVSGRWYSILVDGSLQKVVQFQLTLTGSSLTVKALSAGYLNASGNILSVSNSGSTNDTYYASYTSMSIATIDGGASGGDGYGVRALSMIFGTDARTIPMCRLWLDAGDQSTVSPSGSVTTASLNQYVTTVDQPMTYTGTLSSVGDFTGGTVGMGGAFITPPFPATATLTPSATSGQWYAFIIDGSFQKVVKFQLTLSGTTLTVKALSAGYSGNTSIYLSTTKASGTNDTNYNSFTSMTIATSASADGYGIATLSMNAIFSFQWRDKTTTIPFTGRLGVAYGSTRLNGLNTISFTGNSTTLENRNFLFPNTQCTIYVVSYLNSGGSGSQQLVNGVINTTLSSADFSGGVPKNLYIGASNGNIATYVGNGDSWNDSTANSPTTSLASAWSIMGMTINSSVLTPYINGIAMTTKTGTTQAFLGLSLESSWNGHLAELLIFSAVHSTNQRQQVEGYLAWKWGLLNNLPTNHPYRLIKP